ncbi:uncharacterized protein BO72DRAFT_494290 [Aspergillus fijiensis CBS 313.89]|uniref:Uncharacterized protein n=1 Tax=Aspergillus fijiensis CBS 313.89 TaxID=1448319 RepID=A0A8G1W3T0_9EURO|nr:uncharacterized protein BO72DRAFT_494290 [Aspergillus fijiensis CBS 313.89]RAK79429.1 hypothetical protein BO72DRAFT_494290 [Aspergillus fijiensis CBS 313.89]
MLNTLQQEIDNGNLRDKVNYAMYQVAHAGRGAGGASPPESFQVFALEYFTFFDDALNPICNNYTWAYFPSWMTDQPPLTQELRQQLNDMTRKVNAVIKPAAQDLQRMGVIYVDGLQDAYNGHRFCEPGATKEQTEYIVWFWSQYSHFDTPSEGRAEDDVEATIRPPFPVLRSFHPKGTAYAEHATALFAAIADNRAAIATGGEGQQIAIAAYVNPP